jgi:arginase family enzyme
MINRTTLIAPEYFDQLVVQRNPTLFKSSVVLPEQFQASKDYKFLIAQNDQGVILNRGRQGAKDAGRVLWQHFTNFTKPQNFSAKLCPVFVDSEIEKNEWCPHLIHLGSGHDHVFHLLKLGLDNNIKNFIILNFDAHADMRQDHLLHSGTPFRYFYNQHKNQIHHYEIVQIGLNPFQQNTRDLELPGAQVEILWSTACTQEKIQNSLQKIKKSSDKFSKDETLILVSLDADVLNHSVMPAVSAVNPTGLPLILVSNLFKDIKKEFSNYQKALGIYEYNPLYDNVSGAGAKTLATLMYDWILSM